MAFARAEKGSMPFHNRGAGTTSEGPSLTAQGTLPASMQVNPARGNLNRFADLATNYRQGPVATALAAADKLQARQRADAAAARPAGPLQSLLSRGAGPGIGFASQAMKDDFERNRAMQGAQQQALGRLFQMGSAFEQPQAGNVQRLGALRDQMQAFEGAKWDAWMKKRQSDALAAAAKPERSKFLGIF